MLSSFHSFLGCELPRKHHIIWKKFGSLFAAWVAYQHSLEVHAMCTMHAFHVASAMRFLDCGCWEVEINHSGALFSQKPLRQRSHVVICHIVSILIELQKNRKNPRDSMTDIFFLDVLVFYDSDWFVLVYLTSPCCTFHATSSKVSNVIAASHWQNREPWISKYLLSAKAIFVSFFKPHSHLTASIPLVHNKCPWNTIPVLTDACFS